MVFERAMVEMNDITEIMRQLRQPFRPEDIDWLPGATTKDNSKCMAMPYGDLRAYMDALDDVCGGNWQAVYTPWNDRLICNLTICGVTRSSTGEMDATSVKNGIGGTVAEAQAFKRACAMFGLGRYLYDLPSAWVEFDAQAKKISKAGMAELDSRYRAWYAKKIAQRASETPQQPATQGTGGKVEALKQERRNIEMSDLSKDHEARELARIDAEIAKQAPVNPFEDNTPYFVRDFNRLTGKQYDFVKWTATLHDRSDGPCTKDQYQYLVGIVDALTNEQHNYMLSLLCQSEISKANMPGYKVAVGLLEILPETIKATDENGKVIKGDDGKDVRIANPHHRADIATMIGELAQPEPQHQAA
jgi:hypothetical protein